MAQLIERGWHSAQRYRFYAPPLAAGCGTGIRIRRHEPSVAYEDDGIDPAAPGESDRPAVPFDTRKPFDPSGLRIGTPAITTRGLTEEHMRQIAAWMDDAIIAAAKDDEDTIDRIAGEVAELLAGFPMPGWSAAG